MATVTGSAAQGAAQGAAAGSSVLPGWGTVIGAAAGTISGIVSGVAEQRQASRQRRRVRAGVQSGLTQASREIGSLMVSPEIQAMQQFLYGLYGITPGQRGASGLGSAQTIEGRAVVDPDAPVYGTSWKAINEGNRYVIDRSYRKLAEISRAQRLLDSGAELSPAERSQLEELTSEDTAKGLIKDIEGLSGKEQNWIARFLQEKEGIGAEDFNALYSSLRETAGLAPKEKPVGADLSKGMDTSFNPVLGNFQKSLRQAQASRGLFASNAAAAAEGSGMAAFLFQQQQALLPALQNLATLDIGALAQSIQANRINQQVSLYTGGAQSLGPSPLSQAMQGGLAGAFAGASLDINLAGLYQNQLKPTETRDTNQYLQATPIVQDPIYTDMVQPSSQFGYSTLGAR